MQNWLTRTGHVFHPVSRPVTMTARRGALQGFPAAKNQPGMPESEAKTGSGTGGEHGEPPAGQSAGRM